MKMIRKGYSDEHVYVFTCTHCRCIYAENEDKCEKREVRHECQWDGPYFDYFVSAVCPTCHQRNEERQKFQW